MLNSNGLDRILSDYGVNVWIHCRQFHRFGVQDEYNIYHLNSGVAFLGTNDTGKNPRLLSVLYPRDIISAQLAPPLPNVGIFASVECQLTRLRTTAFGQNQEDAAKLEKALAQNTAAMYARATLHIDRVSHSPIDARLMSFLVELALRTGRVNGDVVTCDLPLSRRDLGSFLAINPDTVSRIFTTFRSKGHLKTIGSRCVIIESINSLFEEFPACLTVAQMIRPQGHRPG